MTFAGALFGGKQFGVEEYREAYWQRIAVACRYGHATLGDVMAMPISDLLKFTEAVGKLIEQENRIEHD